MAAEASLQAVEAVALLSKAYSDAEPLIAELDRLVHAKADDEKVAAETVSARAQQTIGWSIVLIIVGVGMLAWLIGRGIARPLTRMSGLIRDETCVSGLPRPEPLFLPPPFSLFTVAQARRSASSSGTPLFS